MLFHHEDGQAGQQAVHGALQSPALQDFKTGVSEALDRLLLPLS